MNDNKQIVINAEAGTKEVIIREGAAPKLLEPKAPLPCNIEGLAGSVAEYLKKRINTGQFEQKNCTILVDREDVRITLFFNERDEYNQGKVVSQISLHHDFESLRINSSHAWSPIELAMLLKMHRYWFEDRIEGMKLVSTLFNYKADIAQKVEQSVEGNGNRQDNFSQVVNSNLPNSITLKLPIFKGTEPQALEIEFFAKVDGRDVAFLLISPGANEAFEAFRDEVIDVELNSIREIAPEIAIIEK